MKVICVPVVNRPECAVALAAAFDIGKALDASVMGYHLRAHGHSEVLVPEEMSALVEGEEDITDDSGDDCQQSADQLFQTLATQNGYEYKNKACTGPIALWQSKAGSPDKLFSIVGPVTDMIVVSRPQANGKKAKKFMLSALLNSAKPVLVLPQEAPVSIGKRICIAWNQSPEAARAVSAAMPMINKADQVTIVSNGSESRLGPKSRHLQQYLSMHGVNTNHIKLSKSNDTNALLKGYQESQSDLLLMGAYSKSRLRQIIFGGVTEHMLFKADIPVLMLHQ